jgi:hypothetical protein
MIFLELTGQNSGKKVFIAAEAVTVQDTAGIPDFYTPNLRTNKLSRGCCVIDGRNNNGGWDVEETYDQVVDMIKGQVA